MSHERTIVRDMPPLTRLRQTIDSAGIVTDRLAIGYKQRRGRRVVADDISVTLQPGRLICLLGPNGAGKSTLMRTLAGMQPALDGHVALDCHAIESLSAAAIARRLSVVLTERIDVGMLTAYALTALGRHPYTDWTGRLTAQDEAVVRWALEAVGAADLAGRFVHELSDGERQKVLIARALAQEPQVILLDEPTAFLDLPRRVEIMAILRELAHDCERAILLSTHDLDLALRSADVIWLLHDGKLTVGTPEDLVLNGAFERTFRGAGVRFDALSGSFEPIRPAGLPIDVVGDGLHGVWLRRALARAGYSVHTGLNESRVQITPADAPQPAWWVMIGDLRVQCDSVAAVIDVLSANGETGRLRD